MLILEIKGNETPKDIEKRRALNQWIEVVNALGDYGEWHSDVSYNAADVDGIIEKYIVGS
jgi:type III restriction enzyme